MWRWITNARRLVSIVFKGEDPVVRELAARRQMAEARKKMFEDEFVKGIRELTQELKQFEQNVVIPRENARDRYSRLSQELHSLQETKNQSAAVDLEEVHEWIQAVKDGKVEFDINADIKACLQQLRSSERLSITNNTSQAQEPSPSTSRSTESQQQKQQQV